MSFVSGLSVAATQDAEHTPVAAAACMEYKPPQPQCHLTAATRETHCTVDNRRMKLSKWPGHVNKNHSFFCFTLYIKGHWNLDDTKRLAVFSVG